MALMPRTLPLNKFIDLFRTSIESAGNATYDFSWSWAKVWAADAIILHWPDQFFRKSDLPGSLKLYAKITMLWAAKILGGRRVVWVAHNLTPHDTAVVDAKLRDRFFDTLDGIIFLSRRSQQLVEEQYPRLRSKSSLVTVHGHYRDVALSPPLVYRPPQGNVRLGYVGLIRPYKNLDTLVSAAAAVPAIHMHVSGMAQDANDLLEDLQRRAQGAPNITLDARTTPLDDAEVERLIDASDGVVLPYRNILNSGSALHALSRNRPVLAPKIGSLPELQEHVGSDWLYLYEGDLTPKVLEDFADRLRSRRFDGTAPLDAYDWLPIGRAIDGFLRKIRGAVE
ncbi:hypothetical protein ASF45_03080 [Pseudorhodoferax sp. Leaf265]|nr:hypothetical protein ASF45_03080 [Pseudorhodoferax sp. Leaf265]